MPADLSGDSRRAEQNVEVILQEYAKEEQKVLEDGSAVDGDIPDYQLDPEMEMPEIALESAGGAACIGTLEIPSLDLTLPVMSEWSYPLLKLAPCRYAGSAYQGNLVIAAHNYKTHFRKIRHAFGRKRGTFYRCSRKRICISCSSGRGTDSAECGGHDKRRVAAQPFYLYCGWQEPGDGAL